MKIAFICSSVIPENSCGIEQFIYGLLDEIVRINSSHDFLVFIPGGTLRDWSERVKPRHNLSYIEILSTASMKRSLVQAKAASSETFNRISKSAALVRKFVIWLASLHEGNILKKLAPDIIYYPFHLNKIHTPFSEKSVVTIHDIRELQQSLYIEPDARIIVENSKKASAVVSSWKHPYDQILQKLPWTRDKIFLVPFPPPVRADRAWHQLREFPLPTILQDHAALLLYAAILGPHKNHKNLIRALAILVKKKPVRLICTGTKVSPTYEECRKLSKALSVEDNVTFTGFIPDLHLHELYMKADLVVVPTLWEAASGNVFEAFTYGKPVACSDISPLRSQVDFAGAAARFFDPHNPEDIACAILEVLENPKPYLDGSLRGGAFLKTLTWETAAQQYMEIFQWVDECSRTRVARRDGHSRGAR